VLPRQLTVAVAVNLDPIWLDRLCHSKQAPVGEAGQGAAAAVAAVAAGWGDNIKGVDILWLAGFVLQDSSSSTRQHNC
jgi:hypothetical protein